MFVYVIQNTTVAAASVYIRAWVAGRFASVRIHAVSFAWRHARASLRFVEPGKPSAGAAGLVTRTPALGTRRSRRTSVKRGPFGCGKQAGSRSGRGALPCKSPRRVELPAFSKTERHLSFRGFILGFRLRNSLRPHNLRRVPARVDVYAGTGGRRHLER